MYDDDFDFGIDQFLRNIAQTPLPSFGPACLDDEIFLFDVAERAQPGAQRRNPPARNNRIWHHETHAAHFVRTA